MTKYIALTALFVFACACSKSDDAKPASKPTNAEPYTEAKSIELMGKVVSIYEAAAQDCDKLAADLKKFTADNRAEMEAQNAWKAKLTDAQRADLDAKYAAQLQLAKKMMPSAQACGDHPGLNAALKDMPLE